VSRPYLGYSTSKWEHAYIDLYEVLLNPLKHRPDVSFLEFGVYAGESIRYFRDYFTHPDAKIIGFDKHPCEAYRHPWEAEAYSGPTHNVTFFLGNQEVDSDIDRVCRQHGPFDVIMDDASHDPDITDRVFRLSWPHLKDSGLYLVEDIGEAGVKPLLDEVITTKQGRGVICRPTGFGPTQGEGNSISLVLLKSNDGITGLDPDLVV